MTDSDHPRVCNRLPLQRDGEGRRTMMAGILSGTAEPQIQGPTLMHGSLVAQGSDSLLLLVFRSLVHTQRPGYLPCRQKMMKTVRGPRATSLRSILGILQWYMHAFRACLRDVHSCVGCTARWLLEGEFQRLYRRYQRLPRCHQKLHFVGLFYNLVKSCLLYNRNDSG